MFVQLCFLISSVLFASGALVSFEPKPMLDGRIVGGFQIDITQVPWQVSLQRSSSHFCGGSIISDKWILTAAHCTQAVSNNPRTIQVRLGSSEKAKGGSVHKVKRVIRHSKYNKRTTDYDFSLLELENSIEFNENARPIALVDKEQQLSDNTVCLATGWGNTLSPSESNQKLRGAEVPVVNQERCSKLYGRAGGISPRMLCAGFEKGGKDSCQGDSGGPLAVFDESKENAVLVGVVSWGYGCAKPKFPGVYARVTEARDWIFENTGI